MEALDTLVFIENGEAYLYSDAGLRIAKHLKLPWSLFRYFLAIPKSMRDPLYKFIARNRQRIAGPSTSCRIPDQPERAQFIED